jgi:biotin operon repressor
VTQKATVLRLLEARGFKGVSAHELIYQHGITRGAAVIHNLREEGFDIETSGGEGELATYTLTRAIKPPPPPCSCGHRKSGHASGYRCMAEAESDTGNGYCQCERYAV